MLRVIHKYRLYDKISMPCDSKVLHVGIQHGHIHLWVLADPDSELVTKHFLQVSTGSLVPDGNTYLATVHDGQYTWHIFQRDQ